MRRVDLRRHLSRARLGDPAQGLCADRQRELGGHRRQARPRGRRVWRLPTGLLLVGRPDALRLRRLLRLSLARYLLGQGGGRGQERRPARADAGWGGQAVAEPRVAPGGALARPVHACGRVRHGPRQAAPVSPTRRLLHADGGELRRERRRGRRCGTARHGARRHRALLQGAAVGPGAEADGARGGPSQGAQGRAANRTRAHPGSPPRLALGRIRPVAASAVA
mmetsp:Transcript_26384/g.83844  ORF Transcript_26384/g.83844 Transcript_26384/m.83844 type:complete len:223 (+) Transcript_26384:766-1434(+)